MLCDQAGRDRGWLAKVRPWWGHYYHFHVRMKNRGPRLAELLQSCKDRWGRWRRTCSHIGGFRWFNSLLVASRKCSLARLRSWINVRVRTRVWCGGPDGSPIRGKALRRQLRIICILSRSSFAFASSEPSSRARSYQVRACATSAFIPCAPILSIKTGS